MHESYIDILSRIEEQPGWYDQNGTPRYGEFSPRRCPNIYSHKVVLMKIACQCCGRYFNVEMHTSLWDRNNTVPPSRWHYGDPPAHGCIGDTMNCEDLEILQVWRKESAADEWERVYELEGVIDPD